MLVLTRYDEESVWIGEAKIKVLEARHGRVRLGIEAPRDISVDRDEIRKLKQGGTGNANVIRNARNDRRPKGVF